jgi:hypothetical protein
VISDLEKSARLSIVLWLIQACNGESKEKEFLLPPRGLNFINIFSRLFEANRMRTLFWHKNLTKGAQIGRNSAQSLGEIQHSYLEIFSNFKVTECL